jgi:subtilisin family serine protease
MGAAPGCNVILGRTEEYTTEKPIEMVYWTMGVEWADSIGASVLSSSLNYGLFPDSAGTDITVDMLDGHTTIVTRAASIAAAKGMLVVVSAGNGGNRARTGGRIDAPADANGDSVLAIGAVDSLGVRSGFSGKGPTADGRIKPDLMAQGEDVVAALASGDPQGYARATGTSLSAPLVAGLAACLMQARPDWPPVWIVQALKRTASNAAEPDMLMGWGIPDGLAALGHVPVTARGPLRLTYGGPNPLRAGGPAAELRLSLGSDAAATRFRLRLHDVSGRLVRELGSGRLDPGTLQSLRWRGDDAAGRALVPGLYFLSLEGPGRRDVARVVVLR